MKWNKGAPPAVGWWPASISRYSASWRWWNGEHWSCVAWSHYGPIKAARKVAIPDTRAYIEWQNWPKDMRRLPGYPLSIPSQGGQP